MWQTQIGKLKGVYAQLKMEADVPYDKTVVSIFCC